MAIQTRVINDLYTEIYAGGGNSITQSAPTNFHQFYKQKILTPNENIEDYREVTEAEKTALEKSDAAWVEPSDEFVAECESYGAVYNRSSGYFELNGLTDLTVAEMRYINAFYARCAAPSSDANLTTQIGGRFFAYQGRTLYKVFNNRLGGIGSSAVDMFAVARNLEVIDFDSTIGENISFAGVFSRCLKLHTINGLVLSRYTKRPMTRAFNYCSNLKNVFIKYAWDDLDFHDSPLITLESLEYIVNNAANVNNYPNTKNDMIITLHPDAYARLTDELIAEAAAKQITFATT